MKKALVLLGLLFVSPYAHAQHVVSLYDGAGKEIGTPYFDGPFNNQIMVIRTDGLGILLNLNDLTLGEVTASFLHYTEPDCAGQPYLVMNGVDQRVTADWLARVDLSGGPYGQAVALITRSSSEPIVVKSETSSSGCVNISDDFRAGYPATFIDPIEYGLIQIEPYDWWGYPQPLEIRAAKVTPSGEAIFCNGFENCPGQ
jgi:hypothetical protein